MDNAEDSEIQWVWQKGAKKRPLERFLNEETPNSSSTNDPLSSPPGLFPSYSSPEFRTPEPAAPSVEDALMPTTKRKPWFGNVPQPQVSSKVSSKPPRLTFLIEPDEFQHSMSDVLPPVMLEVDPVFEEKQVVVVTLVETVTNTKLRSGLLNGDLSDWPAGEPTLELSNLSVSKISSIRRALIKFPAIDLVKFSNTLFAIDVVVGGTQARSRPFRLVAEPRPTSGEEAKAETRKPRKYQRFHSKLDSFARVKQKTSRGGKL